MNKINRSAMIAADIDSIVDFQMMLKLAIEHFPFFVDTIQQSHQLALARLLHCHN